MRGFKFSLLVISMLLLGFNCALAQKFRHPIWPEDDQQKTLVSNDSKLGTFGAINVNYGNSIEAPWVYIGAEAGIIINDYVILGVAGYGLASNISFDNSNSKSGKLNVYGGYGGILLGAKIAPQKVFHINIPVLLGIGNLEVSDNNYFLQGDTKFTVEKSLYFVVEPRIEAEINITQKLRLGIGGGYRVANGTNLTLFDDQDLSTATYQISLKFGRF